MIPREIQKVIENQLFKGKAILLTGPRQVGKTTLLEFIAKKHEACLYLSGDDTVTRNLFEAPVLARFKAEFGKTKILMLDEAQRIKNIGIALKLITDRMKSVQLIVSGSSSLELSDFIEEPLTGRVFEYHMLPFSAIELVNYHGRMKEMESLERRLIFGSYPDVVNHPGEEIQILRNLAGSYLYKDILSFQQLRNTELIERLLKALALQTGSEVSYNELGQMCGADNETVQKYIRLLELSFVIFRLPSLSRNVRNELKKSRKIYFYDCGIRNAIIGNFNAIQNRNDVGPLWENYIISERYKNLLLENKIVHQYFWRTTQQQEIDYIEESNGKFYPLEIKWNPKAKVRISSTFTQNYIAEPLTVVNKDNYLDYLNNSNFEYRI
jgi:predicted AAA+ superfamily ATPase